MGSSSWNSALVLATLFVAASTAVSVAQARMPDASEWLMAHNAARSAEGVDLPPLTWNTSAKKFALAWANKQAAISGCPFQHSPEPRVYGESLGLNLSTTTGDGIGDTYSTNAVNFLGTPDSVVQSWMSEKAFYSYATKSCDPGQMCGDYTQVVWKETTSVGCAAVPVPNWVCNNVKGGVFFVCEYYPRLNVQGTGPYN